MYSRNKYNAGLGWVAVVIWMAIIIGVVVYCANAPLGNVLLDGLKAVTCGF